MKQKQEKRRMAGICILLSLVLVLLAPVSARANARVTYENNIPVKIVLDPYTYEKPPAKWEITGTELDEDTLKKVAKQVMKDWSPVAYYVYRWGCNEGGTYSGITSNIASGTDWTEWFSFNGDKAYQIDLEDWLGSMGSKTKGKKRSDYAHSTGFMDCDNLNGLRREMAGELVSAFNTNRFSVDEFLEKGGGGDKGALHELKDTKNNGKVYYNIVTHLFNVDNGNRYFYNSYGIAVFDFQMAPIIDPNVEYRDSVTTRAPDSNDASYKVSSYTENKSRQEGEVTMATEDSTTQSITTEITNTESLSFTETIGNEFNFGNECFFTDTLKVEVSATQTMEQAITNGKAVETAVSNNLSTSTSLPPHTAIELIQEITDESNIVRYTCPVALRYKVALFSMSGYAYSDDAYDNQIQGTRSNFSTIFGFGTDEGGIGAPENLYKRAVKSFSDGRYNSSADSNYGRVHGWYAGSTNEDGEEIRTKIDWGWIMDHATNDRMRPIAEKLGTWIPLFGQGASMKVTITGKASYIGDVGPLYQLREIKLDEGEDYYELACGDTMNLKSLRVGGYNEYNVPFYGFDPEKGNWILCNASGAALPSGSDVAKLEVNAATGRTLLRAKNPGEVYLKWVLSDDASYPCIKQKTVTAENNIPVYPMVQIVVNPTPPADLEGYRVLTAESASAVVDEGLNLYNAVSPAVYDSDNILISHAVEFELQDKTSSSPAKIDENGIFTSDRTGSYKARAVYKVGGTTVNSEFFTVTVNPRRELTSIAVSNPADQTITAASLEYTYDLASFVKLYDQYENEWTGEEPELTFALPAGTEGAVIEGGILSVTKGGTYEVTVSAEGLESRTIRVTVRALKELTIADKANVLKPILLDEGSTTVDLSRLTVTGKDQMGTKMAGSDFDIVWLVNGEALSGAALTVDAAGDYTIRAVSGDIVSNELTLTVDAGRRLGSLAIECEELVNDGIGIGSAYAFDLSKVRISAKDQYGDNWDLTNETLIWVADGRRAAVSGDSLVGKVKGEGTLKLTAGDVTSNVLKFNVVNKPYVAQLYASGADVIREEELYYLDDLTITAKDQNNRDYSLSAAELAGIVWEVTDDGTVGSSQVVYDSTDRSLKVKEGSVGYKRTGSVILRGTLTNPGGNTVSGLVTISVKQQPVLAELTLGLADAKGELETGDRAYCTEFFSVGAKDQYGADFDLSNQYLTFACDNDDAFTVVNEADPADSMMTAGKTNTSADFTVTATNRLLKDIISNSVKVSVPRVRTLESVAFTSVPEQLALEGTFDMGTFGAVCYDELGEEYSAEDLATYPAKITYSLDPGTTDAVLDTESEELFTGRRFGYITIFAKAAGLSSRTKVTDSEGNEIETAGTKIWVGPKAESLAAEKTELDAGAGEDTLTLSGRWLTDGSIVVIYDEDGQEVTRAETSGNSTGQEAVVELPANTSLTEAKKYRAAYIIGDTEVQPDPAVEITVKHHQLVHVEAAAATCTADGNLEYWICEECGRLYEDDAAQKEAAAEEVFLKAPGHDWDDGVVTKEATELEEGEITFTCRRDGCGETKTEAVPKLALTQVKAVEATCTKDGSIEYWICGANGHLYADKDAKKALKEEEIVIRAPGHDWDEGKVTKEADEKTEGVLTITCRRCGETKTEAIPKLALTHVEAVEAACTKDGSIEHWICGANGHLYADKDAKKALKEADIVIKAPGHDWDEGVVTKEATEQADGEITYTCRRCGEKKAEPVSKLGLTHVEAVEATCTEDGNIEYWKCPANGHLYADEKAEKQIGAEDIVIKAPGHDWDEGVVTKEATELEEGEKEFTCRRCGEKRTEVIAKRLPVVTFAAENGTIAVKKQSTGRKIGSGASVNMDEVLVITAKPAKGYTFGSWGGDAAGISKTKSGSLTVKKDTFITAAFTRLNDAGIHAGESLKVNKKETNAKLTWGEVDGAEGYDVFAASCGKSLTDKNIIRSLPAGKTACMFSKVGGKPIKDLKCFKVFVKAFKTKNGRKTYIGRGILFHHAGKVNKKYTNAKEVKVKKSLTIKVKGKTALKPKLVKENPKKELLHSDDRYAKMMGIRYYSSDKNVAVVTAKGVIKAVGKGRCEIYVISGYGAAASVSVKVK